MNIPMTALPDYFKFSIKSDISKEQCKDSGLALLLILLLLGYFTENQVYFKLTLPVLLITMIAPVLLKPLGIFWFTFSDLLGSLMSRIILSVIFFAVLLPVAYIRRLFGIDNLKLTQFKKGKESVMSVRDYKFLKADIEKPY